MLLHKNGSSKNDRTQQSIDNAAKTLLANIRFMSVDNPIRTVVVTSTIPNEGKTFVAANLARAMATSGIRTLLVECDMRRRSMAHTLHVHAQHGLYAVMSGEVSLKDAVMPAGTQRLYFLDAEPHIPNPSDLLNSRRFSALIEEAKKEFGYIVFDTPPVGTFVDAAVLGAKVDAAFMVVREQNTRREEVARAAEQLKTANVPLAGVVMNFCERQSSEYYYEYYYREDKPKERTEDRLRKLQDGKFGRGEQDANGVDDSILAQDSAMQPSQPRSWSNAPDLDGEDFETLVDAGNTDDLDRARHARPTRATVPSIGETGVLQRDAISARMHAGE